MSNIIDEKLTHNDKMVLPFIEKILLSDPEFNYEEYRQTLESKLSEGVSFSEIIHGIEESLAKQKKGGRSRWDT